MSEYYPYYYAQHGDYVIEQITSLDRWNVRMAGETPGEATMSFHPTKQDAMAAVKRYQAGDRRRRAS
jgi:hypothetical protein